MVERRNAGGIVAPILKPLEGIDQLPGNRLAFPKFRRSRTSVWMAPLPINCGLAFTGKPKEIKTHFAV